MENYGVRDLTRQVASRIRGAMSQYGVTQAELADAVGVSQSQLSKMVRGTRSIDLDQLDAMCHALGLNAGEVLLEAERFLANYMIAPAARFVFVEEGVRLAEPLDMTTAQDEGSNVTALIPAITGKRRSRASVGGSTDAVDLHTAPLTGREAASDDNTPVNPERDTTL